ncbi:hypothetical protein ACGFNX_41935 [Streptomyces sp. NPDC048723]|uniref:hypothetical protein n=1 Tax=Streptomyces sp. NPDC048723 TaxID=3365589 RepID=UPI00372243E3
MHRQRPVDLPHRHVVGANGDHLHLYSLQPDVTVEAAIRARRRPSATTGRRPVHACSGTPNQAGNSRAGYLL